MPTFTGGQNQKKKKTESEGRFFYLKFPGGYYVDPHALRADINSLFKKDGLDIIVNVINPTTRKFSFVTDGKHHILFEGPAAALLGLKSGEWFKFQQPIAPYSADPRAGFYHMYCYSDVVSPQLVGDVYAPLLRTVDVQGTYGDIVTQYFNPAYYLPVAKHHIENIEIQLKTDQNKLIDFNYGKTIVTLHFRPRT